MNNIRHRAGYGSGGGGIVVPVTGTGTSYLYMLISGTWYLVPGYDTFNTQ